MSRQIVRVEIENSEGEIQYLTGDEAEKWQKAVEGEAVFAAAHGWNFPPLDWQVRQRPEQEETEGNVDG